MPNVYVSTIVIVSEIQICETAEETTAIAFHLANRQAFPPQLSDQVFHVNCRLSWLGEMSARHSATFSLASTSKHARTDGQTDRQTDWQTGGRAGGRAGWQAMDGRGEGGRE